MATNNENDRDGEAKNINSLFEQVFHSEEAAGKSSKRYAVRVIGFENTHTLNVGISKQWYAPEAGRWFPGKKGHVFFSFKVWRDLVAEINSIDNQLKANFEHTGYYDEPSVGGRVESNGARTGGTGRNGGPATATNNADATSNANGASANGASATSDGVNAEIETPFVKKEVGTNVFGGKRVVTTADVSGKYGYGTIYRRWYDFGATGAKRVKQQ